MQPRRLMVLIIVCLVSAVGLVSLAVPEPTTVTYTSISAVTAYGSQSNTLTSTLIMTVSYLIVGGVTVALGIPGGLVETSTLVSTWATTSTVTSYITQTEYSTSQLSSIFTNSTSQMIAAALALVLVVSLLTAVRGWRKREAKPATPTQSVRPSSTAFCINCGNELPPKSKFCNNCGTKQP